MNIKKLTASFAAFALSVSALSLPTVSAETNPSDNFWEKASNDYAYQDYVKQNKIVIGDTTAADIYEAIDEAMQSLWANDRDITNYDEDTESYYYRTNIKIPSSASSQDELLDEWDSFSDDVLNLFLMYLNDHPQVYFSPSARVGAGMSYGSEGFSGYFTIDIAVDEEFISGDTRKAYKEKIMNFISSAGEAENLDSDYKITKYLHDFICNKMEYAFDANGEPDHTFYTNNIIGAVEYNRGVCESYTEALSLLLNYYGVNNVIATGIAGDPGKMGDHAWNMVQLDDGEYYGVDVTFDDGTTLDPDKISRLYFAKGTESGFDETHIPEYDNPDSENYLYQLPEMAKAERFEPLSSVLDTEFIGHSLSLSDNITVNFVVNIPRKFQNDESYMDFSIEGIDGEKRTVKFSEAKKSYQTENAFIFSYDVTLPQLSDLITAEFHYGNFSKPNMYHASDYIQTVIEDKNNIYPEELKNLVTSLSDAGYYSQQILSAYRGWTIGSPDGHASITSYNMVHNYPDLSAYAIKKEGKSYIEDVKNSLVVDSSTAIVLYVDNLDGYVGNPSVTVKDKDGNDAEFTCTWVGDRYRIKIPNIYAANLADTYTVTFDHSLNISVSALSYAAALMGTNDYNNMNLAEALYNYYNAAVNYKAVL